MAMSLMAKRKRKTRKELLKRKKFQKINKFLNNSYKQDFANKSKMNKPKDKDMIMIMAFNK